MFYKLLDQICCLDLIEWPWHTTQDVKEIDKPTNLWEPKSRRLAKSGILVLLSFLLVCCAVIARLQATQVMRAGLPDLVFLNSDMIGTAAPRKAHSILESGVLGSSSSSII